MITKVACEARVHFWIVDDRYVRWRCHDRRCPAVIQAKREHKIAIHVLDRETGQMWDDFEAIGPRTEENHHESV